MPWGELRRSIAGGFWNRCVSDHWTCPVFLPPLLLDQFGSVARPQRNCHESCWLSVKRNHLVQKMIRPAGRPEISCSQVYFPSTAVEAAVFDPAASAPGACAVEIAAAACGDPEYLNEWWQSVRWDRPTPASDDPPAASDSSQCHPQSMCQEATNQRPLVQQLPLRHSQNLTHGQVWHPFPFSRPSPIPSQRPNLVRPDERLSTPLTGAAEKPRHPGLCPDRWTNVPTDLQATGHL